MRKQEEKYREYGERIRYRRIQLFYTKEDLAKISGLSSVCIASMESNKGIPRILSCVKVAKALHCTLEELFGD